jgi:Bacterial PH domain
VGVVITSRSSGGSRRVFRNWFTIASFAALLAIAGANWAYGAGSGAELSAVIAIVGLLLIIMTFRPAIVVTNDHVSVRGWIRTRTESWSSVAGFGFARANPLNRSVVYIEVRLSDGSRLHTSGLTAWSKTSEFALRTTAALEALRPH